MWSTVLVLVNAQSIMYIVFQIYDALRFDSSVGINVLVKISSSSYCKQPNFVTFRSLDCMNMLLG